MIVFTNANRGGNKMLSCVLIRYEKKRATDYIYKQFQLTDFYSLNEIEIFHSSMESRKLL